MAPKVLFLVGAPDANSLDWNTDDLLDYFLEPLASFAGLDESASQVHPQIDGSVLDTAVWRSLPLERARLRTGFSQVHELHGDYHGDEDFFTTLDASFQGTEELPDQSYEGQTQAGLSQFYEHSLAIHDDIRSSQLPVNSQKSAASFDSSEYTSTSLQDSMDDLTVSHVDRTLGLGGVHLSDLEDLPNATYLQSITPQTMTVNLIVGVISVAEPRTVMTRWGASKSLVELLVGDETKSGFSITFWLSYGLETTTDKTLKTLRRQDIIILRNVALSTFNNKVHGHSLRKETTKIDLLYRRKLDEDDTGGFYTAKDLSSRKGSHPQLLKTRRVRDWVLNFVGGGRNLRQRREKGKAVHSWDMPPIDSQ
jgi:hypothetical protein